MNTLLAVVLVCAVGLAPDECTRDTALDVQIVGKPPTPFGCAMGGMLALAHAGEPGPDRYAKFVCERRKAS